MKGHLARYNMLLPLYIYVFNKMMANSLNHGVLGSLSQFSRIMARRMTQTAIEVLLCCLSKLFTSIVNNRLNKFNKENKILNDNQAGFRKGHASIDNNNGQLINKLNEF